MGFYAALTTYECLVMKHTLLEMDHYIFIFVSSLTNTCKMCQQLLCDFIKMRWWNVNGPLCDAREVLTHNAYFYIPHYDDLAQDCGNSIVNQRICSSNIYLQLKLCWWCNNKLRTESCHGANFVVTDDILQCHQCHKIGSKTTLGFQGSLCPAIATINCWFLINCSSQNQPPPPPPPPFIRKTYTKVLFQIFLFFLAKSQLSHRHRQKSWGMQQVLSSAEPSDIAPDRLQNKIWWLCLVPTSTTRFASDVGCRMAKKCIVLYKEIIYMNNDINSLA